MNANNAPAATKTVRISRDDTEDFGSGSEFVGPMETLGNCKNKTKKGVKKNKNVYTDIGWIES